MKFNFLFLKELKQEKTWFIMGLPIFIGIGIALLLFAKRWPTQCFFLSCIPIIAMPIIVLQNLLGSYTKEWRANTFQYLFSLPVRGWHIVFAKLAVNIVILVVFSFIASSLFYTLGKNMEVEFVDIARLPYAGFKNFWFLYILLIIPALPFHLFPYMLTKSLTKISKLRELIIIVVSIGLLIILFNYFLPFGTKMFSFLPEATISMIGDNGIHTSGSANFFPGLAAWTLWGIIMLIGDCIIVDKHIEI
ncbi:MAG: hypothetical protein PHX21_04970 [bacterium]|nr:hypothetical protein [bacterium]